MTKNNESLLTKLVVLLFTSIITITGWLAKKEVTTMSTEVRNMSNTLKAIQGSVSDLNTKALLQEQEYAFKFEWIEKKLNGLEKRLMKLEKN